jgi:hypothetical protein
MNKHNEIHVCARLFSPEVVCHNRPRCLMYLFDKAIDQGSGEVSLKAAIAQFVYWVQYDFGQAVRCADGPVGIALRQAGC